eukprot:3541615-Prymnesium_polylepis.1
MLSGAAGRPGSVVMQSIVLVTEGVQNVDGGTSAAIAQANAVKGANVQIVVMAFDGSSGVAEATKDSTLVSIASELRGFGPLVYQASGQTSSASDDSWNTSPECYRM